MRAVHVRLGQPREVGIWGAVGGKGGIDTRQTGAVTSCLVFSPFCKAAAAKYCSVQGTLLPRTAPHCLQSPVLKSTQCLPHAAPSPDALPSCSPYMHLTGPAHCWAFKRHPSLRASLVVLVEEFRRARAVPASAPPSGPVAPVGH